MALFDGVGRRGWRRPGGQRTGGRCGSTGGDATSRRDGAARGLRAVGRCVRAHPARSAAGRGGHARPGRCRSGPLSVAPCAGDDEARAAPGDPVQPRADRADGDDAVPDVGLRRLGKVVDAGRDHIYRAGWSNTTGGLPCTAGWAATRRGAWFARERTVGRGRRCGSPGRRRFGRPVHRMDPVGEGSGDLGVQAAADHHRGRQLEQTGGVDAVCAGLHTGPVVSGPQHRRAIRSAGATVMITRSAQCSPPCSPMYGLTVSAPPPIIRLSAR